MKGNLFLGYGRGSVGDVVFSRTGGQQVGRARNRRPNNPRSKAQMAQRSLFADAVKFFTRGRQALFQFAFESKSAAESDYNAFMRLNAKNGIMLAPQMIEDPNFPAVGNWIMSQGSLPTIEMSTVTSDSESSWRAILGVYGSEDADEITVGRLSELLVATGEYEVGDILTFLAIKSTATVESSEVVPILPGDSAPKWLIDQIIIDTTDTRVVNDVLNPDIVALTKAANDFYVSFAFSLANNEVGAACTIHSRKTSSGLKVSNQQLMNSQAVKVALERCQRSNYRDFIMYQWGASDTAILEGGIATGRH